MAQSADEGLAVRVAEAVMAAASVTRLFPTGGAITNMIRAGLQMLAHTQAAECPVRIEQRPEGLVIRAEIGVRASEPAASTARRTYEIIDSVVREQCGKAPAAIELTVAYIDADR